MRRLILMSSLRPPRSNHQYMSKAPRQTSRQESEVRRHDRISLHAKTRQDVLRVVREPRVQDRTLQLAEDIGGRIRHLTDAHVESCAACGGIHGHRRDCPFLRPDFDL